MKDGKCGQQNTREIIVYVFWGITTTIVNVLLYTLLCNIMKYWIANIVAIIIGKIYAYFVNKIFVFKSKCENVRALYKEILAFILTRGVSGAIDFFGVLILVEGLSVHKQLAKYVTTIVVISLNYILGKKVVFTGGKEIAGK